MIRKLSFLAGLVLLVSLSAGAQGVGDKVEIFGGYSYMHVDTVGSLNGWELSGQYKINDWLGGVADFDGHYGDNLAAHTFLFGPQVSFPARISPFAHVLFRRCSRQCKWRWIFLRLSRWESVGDSTAESFPAWIGELFNSITSQPSSGTAARIMPAYQPESSSGSDRLRWQLRLERLDLRPEVERSSRSEALPSLKIFPSFHLPRSIVSGSGSV